MGEVLYFCGVCFLGTLLGAAVIIVVEKGCPRSRRKRPDDDLVEEKRRLERTLATRTKALSTLTADFKEVSRQFNTLFHACAHVHHTMATALDDDCKPIRFIGGGLTLDVRLRSGAEADVHVDRRPSQPVDGAGIVFVSSGRSYFDDVTETLLLGAGDVVPVPTKCLATLEKNVLLYKAISREKEEPNQFPMNPPFAGWSNGSSRGS